MSRPVRMPQVGATLHRQQEDADGPRRAAGPWHLRLTPAAACTPAAGSLSHFLDRAAGIQDWLVGTRRELHSFPELLFEEHNTSATIRRHLDQLNIPYQ